MFFRANSSEQIERNGRYLYTIVDLHNKGVYQPKEILLGLFDQYLENATLSKSDPNIFRGKNLFKHIEVVSDLKRVVSRACEDTFAIKVIKFFNQFHLTLHPYDDIFYLLAAFLYTYEYHLPKVNAALRERIYIGNDRRKAVLNESFEVMIQLADKIFENKKREYQHYLNWLLEQFQHHGTPVNLKRLNERADYWQVKKKVFLEPSEVKLVNKKIRQMRTVLSETYVRSAVDFLIHDLEYLLLMPNPLRFGEILEEVVTLKDVLSDEQLKMIVGILMRLNDDAQLGRLRETMGRNADFFTAAVFEPLIKNMAELVLSPYRFRVDICRVLIAIKAIRDPLALDSMLNFLFIEITKRGLPDSFDTLMACRCFFELPGSRKYAMRHPVIAKMNSLLKDSKQALVRAEMVVLFHHLHEEISTDITMSQNNFIEQIINDLVDYGLSQEGSEFLDYVCSVLKLLEKDISVELKKKIIDDQIKRLDCEMDDRACFILSQLKFFIGDQQYQSLFLFILKSLGDPFLAKNNMFLNLIVNLKSIISNENQLELAQFVHKKFCSGSDSASLYFPAYSVLLREFRHHYSEEEIFKIVSVSIDLIRSGQRQSVSLFGDSAFWLNVVTFLQPFAPLLTVDQKIMCLNVLAREARQENPFAHLLFADLYFYYREDIVKHFLLRRHTEAGRYLPPEMVDCIVKFSY